MAVRRTESPALRTAPARGLGTSVKVVRTLIHFSDSVMLGLGGCHANARAGHRTDPVTAFQYQLRCVDTR